MSDLYRGTRKHVQFKLRGDLYALIERTYPGQSVNTAARDLLEELLQRDLDAERGEPVSDL